MTTIPLILLSFLRVWRFVQVVSAYVDIEVAKHNRTKKAADAWKIDLDREKKQNREEVETLREALRLAALDAAAAGVNLTQSGRVSPTDSNGTEKDTLLEGSLAGVDAME